MERKDMHPADIIALLHKRKSSLAALSRQAGLGSSTLANALSKPWPKGEYLIAEALDLEPSIIWPSRYFDEKGNLIDRRKLMRSMNK
ncbi:helix-turn-helix domain-containing protein [Trabulsiella odontotermitis]|uniref:Transcriptional regulator n=1 Tax=Trabulsiella odontotermitis TaxID=379893 RepID=A0A0L0H2H8_9ENTR|nr:helix-turn-helix transcriptional regulator [Trabulsiella odontotermitis]KNC95645.1 transcriptional regulator [Trabulsiella odontotermitis]